MAIPVRRTEVRLAPRSTDPAVYIDFEDQAASDATSSPVVEPLTYGSFLITSFGNTAGSALTIHDVRGSNNPYPTKVLMGRVWGAWQLRWKGCNAMAIVSKG